mmetsp:Transcript_7919/g.26000  ORF Transcript_7919/g.26000 Transcript_7919/m.26000 type:complete len:238 (+) Transcript_7919:1289-2002(+)
MHERAGGYKRHHSCHRDASAGCGGRGVAGAAFRRQAGCVTLAWYHFHLIHGRLMHNTPVRLRGAGGCADQSDHQRRSATISRTARAVQGARHPSERRKACRHATDGPGRGGEKWRAGGAQKRGGPHFCPSRMATRLAHDAVSAHAPADGAQSGPGATNDWLRLASQIDAERVVWPARLDVVTDGDHQHNVEDVIPKEEDALPCVDDALGGDAKQECDGHEEGDGVPVEGHPAQPPPR